MNHYLGKSYTYIDRFEAYGEFIGVFQNYFVKPHVADLDDTADSDTRDVYGFVSNDDGSFIQPLYKNQKNFIMTENGKTFARLAQ